ncbi:RHS repeat-associated core domain-containing protein [Solibacillus isronensis]|uniref:RHS repeat-associated core domain-containing protein n=1 Tax=Solibacillus isronensis TaxID=412383 RepID=UPI0039A3A516
MYDLQYQPKIVVTYKTPSRLGLEDYWDYTSHPLSNGTQFVNLGTLNNILQYQDFSLLNHAGFGLDFIRTYNSKDYEKSAFGYGWTFTGDQKLFIGTGDSKQDIQYKDEDGTIHTFTYKASTNSYESPRGLYDVLNVTDNIYTITTPTGLVTKFEVKESAADTNVRVAYITEQKDLNNNAITYSYNLKNQLESIYTSADSTHQKLVFSYNPSNLISKITHNNQVYTYTYSNDYLIKVTQKRSVTNTTDTTSTEFFYTENNQLAQVKDANGNVTTFMYNSALDLTEVSRNGVMDSTIYKLDRPTSKMTVTSPEGLKTEYTLNGNFIVTEILQPSGERTAYEIDDNYNVLKETIFYTDGTNAIQSYTYNTKGSMLTNIDPNQLVTTYTYNAKQSVLSETAPDKTVIAYTYDNKENLISIKALNGDITTYMNNSMGDLVKLTYPNGSTETYTTSYVNGEESTVYKDDVLGTTSTIVTDMYGNTISSTDEKGQQTNYNYNLKNELTAVIDSEENKTSYTYDGNGNLLTNTNALNETMELTYTPQNQVAKETNARGQETSYSYNKDGDLTGIKKANNDKIAYTFKADGTSTITANGVLQYTTHPDGLTTTAINHNANETVHYTANEDGMLQTVRFNDQSPNDVHYSYEIDKLANVQFGKYKLVYQYNSNSQLSAIVSNTSPLATFTYDKNGLKTNTSFGNSRSAIENGYKGTSTQLQNEKLYTNTLTTPWKTNAYSYDANGNITAVTSGSGTTYYTYDKLNQLTQEKLPDGQIIQYQYDKVGNRTQKTVTKNGVITTIYTFNEANQMTKAGTQDYTVDPNGNLTNDGRYQYEWNAFDQLTGVKTIDGVKVAEYKYDENGRRIYSKVESTETYYRYDGTSNYVLFEENASGVITKTYTYDINGHPLTITYGDSIYYYLTNYRGDVLALTDASGTVVAEYTYDAWGNILSQAGTMASVNPYRYAGYRFDEETKLYYLMARYYNPDTGVFLSLDPVRGDTMNPITMNGYNYANNNPVMMVDPNGESTFSVTFNRIKNALLYGLGKWMSFYIPASLYNSLKNGSIAPYLLFGEKILNGVKASIKAYINGKKTFSYLVADIKNTMANSRQEQQLLLKNAQKQIRKYSAKAASKILLKTVFTWGDLGIIGWYTGSGYINRYGWKQAWK